MELQIIKYYNSFEKDINFYNNYLFFSEFNPSFDAGSKLESWISYWWDCQRYCERAGM